MKNKLFIVAIVAILTFGSVGFALAAPYFQQTQSMVPVSDTANNNIGTTSPSNLRYNGFFKNLTVSGTCTGCGSGSTQSVSTSTNETAGRVPYWTTTSGTPAKLGEVATTTLSVNNGLTISASNGYLLGGSNATIGLAALGSAGVLGAVTATVPTVQATSTLYGAVQNGKILGGSDWNLIYLATTTFSGGLTYAAGNVTNTLTAGDGLTRNTDDFDLDIPVLVASGGT